MLPFLGVLYVLFPIDIITDIVPVLGQIDDLMILTIGAKVFIEMAPAPVVAKYMAQMRGEGPAIVEGLSLIHIFPEKCLQKNRVRFARFCNDEMTLLLLPLDSIDNLRAQDRGCLLYTSIQT